MSRACFFATVVVASLVIVANATTIASGIPTTALPLNRHTPESIEVNKEVLKKTQIVDAVSEVSAETRPNSPEAVDSAVQVVDNSAIAPRVAQSKSFSDARYPKPAEDKENEPKGLGRIWRQLSGIVKGASPSPARDAPQLREPSQEPSEDQTPVFSQVWRQLSGIVIGGKPASPSPARAPQTSYQSEERRGKSLSRSHDAPVVAPVAKQAPSPMVAPVETNVPQSQTQKQEVSQATTDIVHNVESVARSTSEQSDVTDAEMPVPSEEVATNATIKIYQAEDANTVRWAPLKLDDAILVPVYFKPKPKHLKFNEHTRDVTLVGSWSNWTDHFKLKKKGTDAWDGVVNLPVGRHHFKFIVDDAWDIVPQWPVEFDEDGFLNNVIEIPEPSKGMLLREKKTIFGFMKQKAQQAAPPPPARRKNIFGF